MSGGETSLAPLLMYYYPRCGTCRKAKKFLQEQGIEVQERQIDQAPPNKEELKDLIAKSGLPIKKFFNTSGKRYRELQLAQKRSQMSEEEQLTLLASDGMLIKRPIVTDGEKVTVGFREDQFHETWVQTHDAD